MSKPAGSVGRAAALIALSALAVGCESSGTKSDADWLYDHAAKSLADYNSKSDHKAMYCGQNANKVGCTWVWDRPTVEDAAQTAQASCEQKYDTCYQYALDGTRSDWAQRIHVARATGGGGSSGFSGKELVNTLLGVGAIGLGVAAGLSNQGSSPSYGSYNNGSSGGGSVGSGNGYSQRGALEDCAARYREAGVASYAAQCQRDAGNMSSYPHVRSVK